MTENVAPVLSSSLADTLNRTVVAAPPPCLFSYTLVFLPREMAGCSALTIATIKRVAALLARAPALTQRDFGPVRVCMGHDFHLGEAGQ